MSALDPTDELQRIRRIPVQLLIAVRQEYMITHGYSKEPTVGDLFDWSTDLAMKKLSAMEGRDG